MKSFRLACFLFTMTCCISACSILGKRKSGCPQGRNVGAERILQGDKKAMKIVSRKSKLKI